MPDFLAKLGVEHPIVLAPMAGGTGTPQLVAAVSNAGGLGSWGGAYSTPQQILDAARAIRALTSKPFAINLFAGGYEPERTVDPAPMLALLGDIHRELGLTAPVLPPNPRSPFDDQLAAVIEARPAVFSFTFGLPDADAFARLRRAEIVTCGTATTVEEGKRLAEAGVDSIAAQGEEAGAHRGTFINSFKASMVPMRALTRGLLKETRAPVIASGGIMDGREIAEVLGMGAVAGQLGTAFVACPESGAPQAYKDAILAARSDDTDITRVFSGRPARGLRNRFMAVAREEWILPFGQQNDLTRPMRGEAGKQGKADYLSLWAGRGVAQARSMPAAELVRTLVAEMAATR
ncbi:MAG: nitronate monooxygenase [Pseudolabrys sp.]|nr:nitronate monooxygenase [Pseudolabrys sp.]